jgi:hypothetical protein
MNNLASIDYFIDSNSSYFQNITDFDTPKYKYTSKKNLSITISNYYFDSEKFLFKFFIDNNLQSTNSVASFFKLDIETVRYIFRQHSIRVNSIFKNVRAHIQINRFNKKYF